MSREFHYHSPIGEIARDAFALILNGFNFEVSGQEHLNFLREGANAIFAFFPHTGHLDSIAVRKAVPKDLRSTLIYPAAADYWYEGASGKLRSKFSSLLVPNFPINRGGSGLAGILKSLDQAAMFLNSGYSLVISPEGTRSNLPLEERKLLSGVSELVLRTGKPIIPIKLHGLEDVMPRGRIIPKFGRDTSKPPARVVFGEALYFDNLSIQDSRPKARKQITEKLRETLLELA